MGSKWSNDIQRNYHLWGNIVWAHSTSTDLINCEPQDHAIYPSQLSDINGCWSGSATILPDGKPAILYTGINPKNQVVQNLAVPKNLSDPYLRDDMGMWECPDLFPVAKTGRTGMEMGVSGAQVKHVLKADVEISFKVENFEKAQILKPEWEDPHKFFVPIQKVELK